MKSLDVYFCSSFLRSNYPPGAPRYFKCVPCTVLHCKAGLLLNRHSVKSERPFFSTFTPFYLYFVLELDQKLCTVRRNRVFAVVTILCCKTCCPYAKMQPKQHACGESKAVKGRVTAFGTCHAASVPHRCPPREQVMLF